MMPNTERLSRFTRDPEAAGSFQFTTRDLAILRQVAEHRFIKSNWLIKLVGGSRQQVLRRLHLLYHHGYLDRPRAQLDYYHQGGSKSLVYGLTSRGAGRLRRDLNMPFERMDWTTKNRRVGRLFIEHTLMVSDFMASLELDCRERSDVRLLYRHELPKPSGREHFRWTVDLPGKRRVGVVPDKVFAIDKPDLKGGYTRAVFFFEADTGTMPVLRSNLRHSCVERKLRAYQATLASGIATSRLKTPRFHVIILCKSRERALSVRRAIKNLKCKEKLFLVPHIGASAGQ